MAWSDYDKNISSVMYTQGKVADLGYRSATLFSSVLVWDTMEITKLEFVKCTSVKFLTLILWHIKFGLH